MNCRLAICLALLTACAAWAETPYVPRPKGSISFNKDVAPVLFQHCASCHRPGEVAPFPLLTYRDAKKRDTQIALVTQDHLMPPWQAEPGHGSFLDERRLSAEQIGLIGQWVEEGSAEGKPEELPKPPEFTDGWQLGTPDLVLKMPDAFSVPAEGRDVYACFVLPLNFTTTRHIRAVEYRPGNRRVVHHALLFLDSLGQARKKDEADPGPGFRSFGGPGFLPTGGLGGWAPGAMPRPYPAGTARTVKKGTDLVLQLHLHPTGKPELEQSQVGIYFTPDPPTRTLAGLTFRSRQLDIPPGEKNYVVRDSMTLPVDVEAVGIVPHAHLIARDIRAFATRPDGVREELLWIKDWDFNWQGQYQYREPVRLPKGTTVEMAFTYDNSAENPRNPSKPPKRVTWGEQTTDEMALLWLQVMPVRESEAFALKLASMSKLAGQAFGAGGTNGREGWFAKLLKRMGTGGAQAEPGERAQAWAEWRKARERDQELPDDPTGDGKE